MSNRKRSRLKDSGSTANWRIWLSGWTKITAQSPKLSSSRSQPHGIPGNRHSRLLRIESSAASIYHEGKTTSSTSHRVIHWALFYMVQRDNTPENRNFFTGDVKGVVIPQDLAIDINSSHDIILAELIFSQSKVPMPL